MAGFYTDPWSFQSGTMLAGDTTYNMGASISPAVSDAAVTPAATSFNATQAMGAFGTGMAIFGAISSAVGTFYSAKMQKQTLQYQAEMNAINARLAENQAQSLLEAGARQVGKLTLQAGKVKSAQRTAMAANGIDLGEGNAAEVVATTDLMKEVDALTINANSTRAAWAARTQSTNLANEALIANATASTISPATTGTTSLLTGAGTVASAYYRDRKQDLMARALGLDA